MRRPWALLAALALIGACSSQPSNVSAETHRARTPPPATTIATTIPATIPATIPTTLAIVTRVVDGDTAHMRLADGTSEKVRFIGVDTPESTTRHEPYGAEASAFTKSRLSGATVFLEYDLDRRDRYGRLLAYVWIRPPADGSAADVRANMFNAILVSEGYASILTVPPNVKYVGVFRDLEVRARAGRRGLWRL